MAFTYDYDLPEMPTGAVEWPAIINDIVFKVNRGRTIKATTTGSGITEGDPVYLNIDGQVVKATDGTPFVGIWISPSSGVQTTGFIQIDGRVGIVAWAFSTLGDYYLNDTGAIVHLDGTTVNKQPIGYYDGYHSDYLTLYPHAIDGLHKGKDSIGNQLSTVTGTSSGNIGDFTFDATYFYCCTAENVWKRIALTTF